VGVCVCGGVCGVCVCVCVRVRATLTLGGGADFEHFVL